MYCTGGIYLYGIITISMYYRTRKFTLFAQFEVNMKYGIFLNIILSSGTIALEFLSLFISCCSNVID